MAAVSVKDGVRVDALVPYGHALAALDLDAEETLGHVEQSGQDTLVGEVWTQVFFVEVVALLAQSFRLVEDVPGCQLASGEVPQLFVLPDERALSAVPQFVDKRQSLGSGFRHPIFQYQVREVRVAQHFRLLLAESQDPENVLLVVVLP